jgi:Icc-related predicted phosphoesterase
MASILHVSDFHFNRDWFAWVDANAHRYDLVCLSGDALDMESDTSLSKQVVWLATWLEKFHRHGIPIALCSGNHDIRPLDDAEGIPPELLSRLLATPNWMDAFKNELTIVDQENRVVPVGKSKILVTTLPYHDEDADLRQRSKALWNEGTRLRAQHKIPWIVLAHLPPADTCIGDLGCDQDLLSQIEDRQPDHVLCGHVHARPYTVNGSWKDQIGRTFCYNPGFASARSAVPNHITIDTKTGKSQWFSIQSRAF